MVCANFDQVMVIYNGANQFELGFVEEYDPIKSGGVVSRHRQRGFNALGKVLSGGKSLGTDTDTFVYDMSQAPLVEQRGEDGLANLAELAVERYERRESPKCLPLPLSTT